MDKLKCAIWWEFEFFTLSVSTAGKDSFHSLCCSILKLENKIVWLSKIRLDNISD